MRARHINRRVEPRTARGRRIWYGHYYPYITDADGNEKRTHCGLEIGERATMSKFEAEEKLDAIVRVEAKQTAKPKADERTLAWYVDNEWVPMFRSRWEASTRSTNLGNIAHIKNALGDVALTELSKKQCQNFLDDLAETKTFNRREGKKTVTVATKELSGGYSFTVVNHCKILLKAILEEALEADLIAKNPARKIETPKTKTQVKRVMPEDQARQLIDALPLRDRLITMIGTFCALRPGEIFGLKFSSYRVATMNDGTQKPVFLIEGTAWRGQMRDGKAKTEDSKSYVPVPDQIVAALADWAKQQRPATEDELLFPSDAGRLKPMRPENWLRRRLKPIAQKLGIAINKVTFQVLRRSFGTHAAQFTGDIKTVQGVYRHTKSGTTLDHYQQRVDANTSKLVNDYADYVMGLADPKQQTRRVQ